MPETPMLSHIGVVKHVSKVKFTYDTVLAIIILLKAMAPTCNSGSAPLFLPTVSHNLSYTADAEWTTPNFEEVTERASTYPYSSDSTEPLIRSKDIMLSDDSQTFPPSAASVTTSNASPTKPGITSSPSPSTIEPHPDDTEPVTKPKLSPAEKENWNDSCVPRCVCTIEMSPFSQRMLRTVDCSHHNLHVLPTPYKALTEVILLNGNSITDLHEGLADMQQLKELDLSDNQIKSLGRGFTFHGLLQVVYLNLARNDITSLLRDAFRGLSNLKVLLLTDNHITYIEDGAFLGLAVLKQLDLGRNQLNNVFPEWFRGLNYLSELHLFDNRIHHIPSATFRPLRRLRHLSLFGNRIAQVSSDGFWGLDELETLHFERNYFEEPPMTALQHLKKLKYLFLSGNPFQALRSKALSDLNLLEVTMNSMPALRIVDKGAFHNLTSMTGLYLQDCPRLAYLAEDALSEMSNLKELHLEGSKLLGLNEAVLRGTPKALKVYLRGNPLHCDCSIAWIRLNLLNGSGYRNFPEGSQLICNTPVEYHGFPITALPKNDTSKTKKLTCQPTVVPTLDQVVQKRMGERLSLDCRALGIPAPSISWIFPENRSSSSRSSLTVIGSRVRVSSAGTLTFYHLKQDDTGNYTCRALNSVGSTMVEVVVNVKKIDLNLFPTSVSSNSVTLVWNGTARSSYPQLHILYRKANRPSPQTQRNNQTAAGGTNVTYSHVSVSSFYRSYIISELSPESEYEFCIATQDKDGYFVQLACTWVQTQDSSYMLRGIKRTSNVAMAIVLTVVVLMLVVLCSVSFTARKIRQRQYVCPEDKQSNSSYVGSSIPMENLYSPLISNLQ